MSYSNFVWSPRKLLCPFLLCLFVTPAMAVSVQVRVVEAGSDSGTNPNRQAFSGATVSLGDVTATVGADGIASFDDVPEGEHELSVHGKNLYHRPERVMVTEGATLETQANYVSALQTPGQFQASVTGFSWDGDDWQIDVSTNTSIVTVRDAPSQPGVPGDIITEFTIMDPSTNDDLTIPVDVSGQAAGFKWRFAEVGGNSPWAGFYLVPMIGTADGDLAFESAAIGPQPIEYSGDSTIWGVGLETVIKPDSNGRFYISLAIAHSETDTFDVDRTPVFPGLLSSTYELEFDEDKATLLFGFDGDLFAPFAGVERIDGNARLTGDFVVDGQSLDPTLPAGSTVEFSFDNRFDNEATLGVAGVKFRIPNTRLSGMLRWSGDGDNSHTSLHAYYGFGGGRN